MAKYLVICPLLLTFALNSISPICAVNVLAVLPSVWKSHYLFGRRLLEQLVVQRNYSATIISPYATLDVEGADGQRFPKIREIQIEGLEQNWLEMGLTFDVEQIRQKSVMERFTRLIYAATTNVDLLLSDAQVRKLLRSDERFDLLMVDLFLGDSLLGFSLYYQIPTVVISPTGPSTWINAMVGNPQNSALDPSNFLPYTERMGLWERSMNTLMGLFEKLTYNFFHMISQQVIYKKHFEALCQLANITMPHHRELTKNLSLVLLNSHPVLQYPRANLPNMLEIAGVHLQPQDDGQKLPNHLKDFMLQAPDAVVYMSLGANVRISDLASEKLAVFFDVFESLKEMRFLVKWDLDDFPGVMPKNVLVSEWFPQEWLLAHPKVKVFISSCGAMSVIEAIHSLTPLFAIPIYPEQEVTAKRLQKHGVSLMLPIDMLAHDSLLYGIQQLAYNESFQTQLSSMKRLLHYDYTPPSEKVLHYIDMIVTTAGGDFLKSHANKLNFAQTEILDVIAILAAGLLCIVAVPFLLTCCILKKSYNSQANAVSYRVTLNSNGRRGDVGAGDNTTLLRRRRSSTSTSTSSSAGGSPGCLKQRRAFFVAHSQSSQQSD